jgi:DNA-directed RNA polymerase
MDEIIECAEQPLSGSRSWMHKDDPWQYLAACIEYTNVTPFIFHPSLLFF